MSVRDQRIQLDVSREALRVLKVLAALDDCTRGEALDKLLTSQFLSNQSLNERIGDFVEREVTGAQS